MNTLKVVNLKCGGCEAGVESALKKAGLKEVTVKAEEQTVSFRGDTILAEKILTRMGYPLADSQEAKSLTKKAKSYISCAIGKTKK